MAKNTGMVIKRIEGSEVVADAEGLEWHDGDTQK